MQVNPYLLILSVYYLDFYLMPNKHQIKDGVIGLSSLQAGLRSGLQALEQFNLRPISCLRVVQLVVPER